MSDNSIYINNEEMNELLIAMNNFEEKVYDMIEANHTTTKTTLTPIDFDELTDMIEQLNEDVNGVYLLSQNRRRDFAERMAEHIYENTVTKEDMVTLYKMCNCDYHEPHKNCTTVCCHHTKNV